MQYDQPGFSCVLTLPPSTTPGASWFWQALITHVTFTVEFWPYQSLDPVLTLRQAQRQHWLFYFAFSFDFAAPQLLWLLTSYQHSANDICSFSNPSCHAPSEHGMKTCLCLSGVLGCPPELCVFVQARRLKLCETSIIDVISTEAEALFGFEQCLLGLLRGFDVGSEICL